MTLMVTDGQREADELLLQKRLGAALRTALEPTLALPLPVEMTRLLDLLSAREIACKASRNAFAPTGSDDDG